MNFSLRIVWILGSFLTLPYATSNAIFPKIEPHWNWHKIDTTVHQFPPLVGTASSDFQTCGSYIGNGIYVQNSWLGWEDKKHISQERKANAICHEWDEYQEAIKKAQEAGFNILRVSIAHSKVEQEQGTYDTQVLDHYVKVIDTMIEHNIEPEITLFHHEWPVWFDKLNHFEDERNIPFFVQFATYTFDYIYAHSKYPEKIRYWLTLNEPTGYALGAYVYDKYYPGKKYNFLKNILTAGVVTYNMYQAHSRIYDAFKEHYDKFKKQWNNNHTNEQVQVSFAHAMNPLHAYHPWNPVEQGIVKLFGYLLNDLTLDYYRTGHFNWPGFHKYDPEAPQKLDFVGLNYYSHTVLRQELTGKIKEAIRPNEIPLKTTGNTRTLYAEGFYDAIKRCTALNKPIFITENGCATDDPALRTEYFKRHLYIVSKAMQEGINIIGYLVWTLTDCYSWSEGGLSKYGLLAYNPETKQYTIKPGTEYLLDVIKKHVHHKEEATTTK